jgi:hypothetical protein
VGALDHAQGACFEPDRVLALRQLRQMVKMWRLYCCKVQKTRAVTLWHMVQYPCPGPLCVCLGQHNLLPRLLVTGAENARGIDVLVMEQPHNISPANVLLLVIDAPWQMMRDSTAYLLKKTMYAWSVYVKQGESVKTRKVRCFWIGTIDHAEICKLSGRNSSSESF